jgi:hypothetical protein
MRGFPVIIVAGTLSVTVQACEEDTIAPPTPISALHVSGVVTARADGAPIEGAAVHLYYVYPCGLGPCPVGHGIDSTGAAGQYTYDIEFFFEFPYCLDNTFLYVTADGFASAVNVEPWWCDSNANAPGCHSERLGGNIVCTEDEQVIDFALSPR